MASPGTGTAFIVGATGEVGKALVSELLRRGTYQTLRIIGRRECDVGTDVETSTKVEQHIVDFDNLSQKPDAFSGAEVGFCCLGTTRGKAGKEGFIKVDHDYVVNTAKQAKESGCSHFVVVSASSSNKNSMLLYSKTKGLMEEHVTEVGFPKVSFFRPGLLVTDRQESRPAERFAIRVLNPMFDLVCPNKLSVQVPLLAKAMVNHVTSKQPIGDSVVVIPNDQICRMAQE